MARKELPFLASLPANSTEEGATTEFTTMNATNQNDNMDLPPLTCVAVVCREISKLQAEKQIVRRIDDFIDYSIEFSFTEACYTSIALAKRVFIRSGRDQEEIVTRIVSSASNGDLHELKVFRRVGKKVAGIRSRDLVNTQSFWGMLPAGSAAQGGYHRVLKWLVRKGAKVDKKDSQGKTTFHWACEMGHLSMVKWLVDQGVKLDEKDSTGCTALHLAAGRGELSVAKYLLKTGAQANAKDAKGWTVLHYAARGGLLRLVLRLVKKGVAVDCIDSTGKTPLHVAVTYGHENIARFLVENGVCALSVDGFGHSALYYAMEWRDYKLAKWMIEASNKTETSQLDLWEILLFAAAADQTGIIERLRETLGVDVCVSLRNGRTALHEAAKGGAANAMQLLLERGLSITQADGFGTTSVIEACRQGLVEILHQALNAGGTIGDIDLAGRSPLHYAAEGGHVDIVEALLERNADLNSRDKRQWTPLHCAAEAGHEEVVNLLLAHEAQLRIKTIAGMTALSLALERGHLNVVQILKEFASLHDISVNNSVEMLATTPTEYFLNPTDISFEAPEFEDKGSGLWLGSPIEVKLKKSWSTNFVEELGRWAQLNHPHVVKLFGVCYGDGVEDPCFVFERAIQGSLFEYLEKAEQRLTSAELWSKIFEAALGLQYLHDHGIVHCHFSCDSIVVAENGVAKLRNLSRDGEMQGSQLGFNAPEVVSGLPHSFQSDVYAFGLSIIQAVTTSWNPWVANGKARGITAVSHPTMSRDTMILSGKLPNKPAEMNSIQWDLVCRMCSYNPHDRPSALDVVLELEAFTHENTLQYGSNSEKEKLSSDSLSRTIQDDETSVWGLLANVDDMCKLSTTTNEMNRDVYDRLVHVFEELKSMNAFTVKAVARQFADIVRQLHHALERMHSEVLTEVTSIGASRQLADAIFSVHKTLDVFIESAALPGSKLSKSWQARWELHRTLQQEEALSAIENLSDLLESGGATNDQNQTSRCVSYELSNLLASYDASNTTDKARITSIKDLFPNLENAPWFIPAYEVDFDRFDEFSHGAFGKVYHGKWKRSRVVVKKVELQNDNDQAAFLNEVEIWHKLYHPDVVQMFGACHVDNPFFLCEYAGGGQLDDYLRLHPDKIWDKLYEAALGLRYLHVKRVVHSDLKCNNILIGNDGRAKLTDFGLSRLVANTFESEEPESEEHGGDNANVGAVRWKAPEVLRGEKATFASDVYSFGMCILEAVSGKFPWGMLDDLAVKYHVKHGSIPQRPPNCSEKAYKLVKRMCTYDPSARMETKEVVNALDALR